MAIDEPLALASYLHLKGSYRSISVMGQKEFFVKAAWDHEAGVYYVKDTDIPGLNAEAETFEAFMEVALELAPQLLKLNVDFPTDLDLPLSFTAEKIGKVRLSH